MTLGNKEAGSNMQILVADDHQLFLDGIWHILKKLDIVVDITEATNAERAIKILEQVNLLI